MCINFQISCLLLRLRVEVMSQHVLLNNKIAEQAHYYKTTAIASCVYRK